MELKLDLKKDFPIFSHLINGYPLTYLDTAATAHKPAVVIEAISDFYGKYYGTVFRGTYGLSQNSSKGYLKVRDKVKVFLNADRSEEIVFLRGCTHALNILARSVVASLIKPKDSIVVSDIEHHSNVISWQLACESKGIPLKQIRTDSDGFILLDHLEELLVDGARFVSIPHVSNVFGSVQPLKEIASLVHKYGAYLCVDGAQGAPHIPVDVDGLDIDFYIFSGHKLYGPTGVGVLYGKYDLLDRLEPVEGGGDMVETYHDNEIVFAAPPMKFEAGTPPIASVIGLGSAIDYLENLGMEAVFLWERRLVDKCLTLLSDLEGVRILGTVDSERRGSLISFSIDGAHSFDVGLLLDRYGISVRTGNHCSQPAMSRAGLSHSIRVSFGVYNTEEDVNRFMEALNKVLNVLKN